MHRMEDGAAVLSETDLVTLRRAAAMAHTIGGLTLRVSSAGEPLATVMPRPIDPRQHAIHPALSSFDGPVLDPCGFRMAVGRAWTDHQHGQRVAMIGQQTNGIEVDWSIAAPGQLLGFGAVRTPCAGRILWALPSLLEPDSLMRELESLDDPASGHPAGANCLDLVEARLVRDDLLGVSIVHVELATEGRVAELVPVVDEVVRGVVAASGAAELLQSLVDLAA